MVKADVDGMAILKPQITGK